MNDVFDTLSLTPYDADSQLAITMFQNDNCNGHSELFIGEEGAEWHLVHDIDADFEHYQSDRVYSLMFPTVGIKAWGVGKYYRAVFYRNDQLLGTGED